MTLREIYFVIKGATDRHRREHDERMSLAWHTAFLSSYPPQKAKDFPRLEKLLSREPVSVTTKPAWQAVLAKVQAWGSPKS